MARFLFVAPPFAGHVLPVAVVAEELERRGHAVAWAVHPTTAERWLPQAATVIPLAEHITDAEVTALHEQAEAGSRFERLKFYWQDIVAPLARDMLPEVERAIGEFGPDAVVADQHALAGGIAARRLGVHWATSAPTGALLDRTLDALPNVRRFITDICEEVSREAGLEPVDPPDCSPELAIAFTSRELSQADDVPAHYRLVGSCFSADRRFESEPFPWDELGSGRLVYVTLGTVSAGLGARFLATLVDALAGDETIQLVVAAPPELVSAAPNVLVRPLVPQLALLRRADAVVFHGGYGTAHETLAHGVPSVVAPINDDQPLVAQLVEDAGAGIRVSFKRSTAEQLREAVETVLADDCYRGAAHRIAASFAAAGGAPAAADALEELLA